MNSLPPFFQAHGGLLGAILLAVVIFNVIMTAMAKIFETLGKQEPQWMQTAGAWGLKIAQWLSANPPSPDTAKADQVQPAALKPPNA